MKIVTGIDIVYVPRFKKALRNGGENFLRRVYLEDELDRHLPGAQRRHLEGGTRHLAGIFAAKEAVIKALSLPPGSWHDIEIFHKKNGNPQVQLLTSHFSRLTSSLSISHDGNYVIAQFVALVK